jgi:excisionase family DNA binding protein
VDPTSVVTDANEEYLSAGDAARLLCVSARTVSRWADQGRIPHLVTMGGHRRFRKSSVLKLLGPTGRAGATAPPTAS